MSQNLIEMISKGMNSYNKIKEAFLGSEQDLIVKLNSLLEQEVIFKKEVLLCSECGVTLGPIEQFKNNETTFCINCEHYTDIIEENYRTFYFKQKHHDH